MGTKSIAVIDAETDPFDGVTYVQPFVWGFYDGENYEQFEDTDELARFLYDKEIIVYAHNGGRFDYHLGLLDHANEFDKIMIVNGRVAKFHIGLCELRDSFNILPVPLAAYQKTEIDYSIFKKGEREKPHNWKKITDYLYDDCRDLWQFVMRFIEEYGLNLTQASASLKQWRKISGEKPPRSTKWFYDRFRPYYYGGRVQCFRPGYHKRDVQLIDINSAYPYAMLHNHPISTDGGYEIVDRLPKDAEKIGPSFWHIKANSKGAFPLRGEDGSLYFPNDDERRDYYITGWELLAAVETQTVTHLEIVEGRIFEEFTNFSDYINHFYEKRLEAKQQGDKAGDLLAKLSMNSLYGKFAANPNRYAKFQIVSPTHISDMEADGYQFAGELGSWALGKKQLESDEQRYFNIATAASITGFVRAYLWRAICQCEGVYYCDTDSILCERAGESVPFGLALGEWEIEGEFDRAAIAGKKLYALRRKSGGWKTASKGVKLSARQICAVSCGKTVTYYPDAPTYSIYRVPEFTPRKIRRTG